MKNKQDFNKKPASIEEQISILVSRGLIIEDIDKTSHQLCTVGYYRLSAYFKIFQFATEDHTFKTGITFDDIWNIYTFDRKLRLIVSDVIERIEVALRSSLTNILAHQYGAYLVY